MNVQNQIEYKILIELRENIGELNYVIGILGIGKSQVSWCGEMFGRHQISTQRVETQK